MKTILTKKKNPESSGAGIQKRKAGPLSRSAKRSVPLVLIFALAVFGGGLELISRSTGPGALSGLIYQSLPVVPIFSGSNQTAADTAVLSREYIYAGRRLLAVEDAGAVRSAPADLAVWRPSSGTWWVHGGQDSGTTSQSWGAAGDIPTQGDFDGDGKTDFCIFRPSNGQWWILKSSEASYYAMTFGANGDVPAHADYDGDGKTDVAVWRPSNGFWYVIRSSDGSVSYTQFGISGDKPAPADYDGDGRDDIGVWRGSAKTFYSINSSNSAVRSRRLEPGGNQPVSADYDGDGRADYAIRSGDSWIIANSAGGGIETVEWQSGNDVAVQNDYDGDGRVDIAVWRNSNGNWYIRKSSDLQLRREAWGMAGDIPVPAFYRR